MKSTIFWATQSADAEVGAGDDDEADDDRRWPGRPAGDPATVRAAARPSYARRKPMKRAGPGAAGARASRARPRGAPPAPRRPPALERSSSVLIEVLVRPRPRPRSPTARARGLGIVGSRSSGASRARRPRRDRALASNSSTSPEACSSSPGMSARHGCDGCRRGPGAGPGRCAAPGRALLGSLAVTGHGRSLRASGSPGGSVCGRHHLQYLRSVMRSGLLRLDLFVW